MRKIKVKVVRKGRKRPKGNGQSAAARLGTLALRAVIHPVSIAVGVLTFAGLSFGTPHVAWEYGCAHPRHSAWSECRQVSWCAYYGFQGRRTATPDAGERCDIIRLMPIK